MRTASVSELKASLSEYLGRVKKGEEVLVTERGGPVAKVIPFRVRGSDAKRRLELAERGILTLGTDLIPNEILKPSPVKDPTNSVRKALQKEREDGW